LNSLTLETVHMGVCIVTKFGV